MPCFLGIDGGGTKTACLLVDEKGQKLAQVTGTGTSHRQHGGEAVLKTLRQLARQCAQQAGISLEQLGGVCVGLPAYGENATMDAMMREGIHAIFPHVLIVNDVQVGWAGSLACMPGIHVVAGTGSIAFGCDQEGHTARSGGWCEHFGDEGSSYWLAKLGMQLFTKQADGRVPRGAMYTKVREAYGLDDDYEFVRVAEQQLLPKREKTAAFQRLVADAAKEGDASVPPLYQSAGAELAQMAEAVKRKLRFGGEPVPVSYSGGTFLVGDMLLAPFRQALEAKGMDLRAPLLSPVEGAALLAVKTFAPPSFADAAMGLQSPPK